MRPDKINGFEKYIDGDHIWLLNWQCHCSSRSPERILNNDVKSVWNFSCVLEDPPALSVGIRKHFLAQLIYTHRETAFLGKLRVLPWAFLGCPCKKHPFEELEMCSSWTLCLCIPKSFIWELKGYNFHDSIHELRACQFKQCSDFSLVENNKYKTWVTQGWVHYLLMINKSVYSYQTLLCKSCRAFNKLHILTWTYY